jgi:hypothetical protein
MLSTTILGLLNNASNADVRNKGVSGAGRLKPLIGSFIRGAHQSTKVEVPNREHMYCVFVDASQTPVPSNPALLLTEPVFGCPVLRSVRIMDCLPEARHLHRASAR